MLADSGMEGQEPTGRAGAGGCGGCDGARTIGTIFQSTLQGTFCRLAT